jgi:hypothetical protein
LLCRVTGSSPAPAASSHGSPGTSVEQIDRTYGHLLPDSIDRTKAALDALVERMGTDRALETEASE